MPSGNSSGILAPSRRDEGLLPCFAQSRNLVPRKGHKYHIQLEHAATAGPHFRRDFSIGLNMELYKDPGW